MFLIDCSRHSSRVLVPSTRIRGFVNTNVGILVDLECWCGEHVQLLTGRHRIDAPIMELVGVSPRRVVPRLHDQLEGELALAGSAHGSNL